jgi:hypothetical protein
VAVEFHEIIRQIKRNPDLGQVSITRPDRIATLRRSISKPQSVSQVSKMDIYIRVARSQGEALTRRDPDDFDFKGIITVELTLEYCKDFKAWV